MFAKQYTRAAVPAAYLGISSILFMYGYIKGDATFWMGIVLIPLLLHSFPPGEKTCRLAPVVAMMLLICCFRQELTWRFLLLVLALLFAVESLFGKLNGQFFTVLLIISPIFRYVSEVFTFPIRLQISAWAGILLQSIGLPVTVEGNSILLNGSEFSVDPACMGLQMTGFALLAVVFFMAHFRIQRQQSLPSRYQATLLVLAFALNAIGNLMRIILLVALHIAPDNVLHDATGIVCLIVYVVIPLFFMVRITYQRWGKAAIPPLTANKHHPSLLMSGHWVLLVICVFFCFQKPVMNIRSPKGAQAVAREGYVMQQLQTGVTQFRNDHALVYMKPIPAFYSSEHSPLTCWTGSGYHLSRISKKQVAGRVVYVGSLKKGNDELLTAWWLSDGRYATISQLDWRWKSLSENSDFQLINVTANDPIRLDMEVKRWLPPI
ncbi:exosortase N [Dyadobacter jiangsuensis]